MSLQILQVDELCSKTFVFTLTDESGAVIPLANLSTAQLTLYDLETRDPAGSPATGVINSRDLQDVKNANNVTIHATNGTVTWSMQPADNPIVTDRRQVEIHRAEFRFVTTGGAEVNRHYQIEVRNLGKAS